MSAADAAYTMSHTVHEGEISVPEPPAVGSMVFTYAICHFVVDLACVSTMLGAVSATLNLASMSGHPSPFAVFFAILLYDVLAFALQLPIGALLDRVDKNQRAALVSFALITFGIVVSLVPLGVCAWISVCFLAIGNAVFHCAGGIDVLNVSEKRAAPSGIFISTGAAGVFLATLLVQRNKLLVAFTLLTLLLICAAMVFALWRMNVKHWQKHNLPFMVLTFTRARTMAVVLLAATVLLRSYAGMVMTFPWKADPLLAAFAVGGVVVGKACGGVIADKYGLRLTSAVSLATSMFLFLFAWEYPVAGLLAVFLFNFTMPITLSVLARLLPSAKGTAFGIASFSLAVGSLPALLGFVLSSPLVLAALAAVSLALLLGGLYCADQADACGV